MRPLRPSASVLAAILMVALTAFGRVKPQPVDAESLLIEYFRILESSNPEEELNRWTSSKSEPELAAIPIVVGNGLLNQIEGNALTDSAHYNAYMSAIGLIEKGVKAIEKSGVNDALYLITVEIGRASCRERV